MKKLTIIRFLLKPNSLKTQNPNSSITPSTHTFTPNYSFCIHRCFSAKAEDNPKNVGFRNTNHSPLTRKTPKVRVNTTYVSPKTVSQVIDLINNSKDDCRSKLDLLDIKLSTTSVCEIFQVLSCQRVHGLQFFEWVRDNNWDSYRKADVYSLMIDNCGWLEDYDTMTSLLQKFNQETIILTDKAFGFLPVLGSSKNHIMESIKSVIAVLDKVGGSSRKSGIPAMIHMLCAIDSFEMAKFVIEVTEKNLSYFAILVREKCKKGLSEEAYAFLHEMRAMGCEPDTKIFNYILGSLCKSDKLCKAQDLLKEMKGLGVNPDLITFEILITCSCRVENLELANQILMDMGCSPRLETHGAMVKGYYNCGRKEDAYNYVRDLEVKRLPAINKMYSLLARLHQKDGNIEIAHGILNEMMEKGLKPDFLYYNKVKNVLRHSGERLLAQDLQKKYSRFKI